MAAATATTLAPPTDNGQQSRPDLGSLDYTGTSARLAEWFANLEHVWRTRTSKRRRWLVRRQQDLARRLKRLGGLPGSPELEARMRALEGCQRYAAQRSRSMGLPRLDVLRACERRWRQVQCRCGTTSLAVGCDQPMLCERCARRHWSRWRRRIVRSLSTHLRAAVAEWGAAGGRGPRPQVYLVTLTAPHSGDLEVDRERFGAAWRQLFEARARGQLVGSLRGDLRSHRRRRRRRPPASPRRGSQCVGAVRAAPRRMARGDAGRARARRPSRAQAPPTRSRRTTIIERR